MAEEKDLKREEDPADEVKEQTGAEKAAGEEACAEDVSEEDISEKDVSEKDIPEEEKENGESAGEDFAEDETAGEETKEKRSFFKRKDKDKKKVEELTEKLDAMTDRYTRLMAEFDNFRKRTEKEKSGMFDMGVSTTIEKILPIVDNFERGLASVPEEKREDAVYTGMDQIYKQTVKVLTDMGVEPMDAAGKEFDPNLHNAVMQVEDDEKPENTVAQELLKGYTYKGSVVRHAMVSVVK